MKKVFFLLLATLTLTISLSAQTDEQRAAQEAERKKKLEALMTTDEAEGWQKKGGLGVDLAQLLNINPYIGGGSNRLGLGGAISYHAIYNRDGLNWKNALLVNLSTQRIGSGIVAGGFDNKLPFEKALDVLSFSSSIAYTVKKGSKWSYAADLGLLTQLLGSYVDSATSKVYLQELKIAGYNTSLKSKFMSPGLVSLAPGIKYEHNKHFNAFLSPCGGRLIVIADQSIADLGIHGTDPKDDGSGYKTSRFELGAMAKLGYINTFWTKLNFSSDLTLFSNYLDKPQNIDVIWFNTLGVEIFKGLSIGIQGNVFYDDNRTNYITDFSAVGGTSGQGKRVNFIEQLLITYSRNF